MKTARFSLLALLAVLSSAGNAADLKFYLMTALNNPATPVSGRLTGGMADSFRATTRSAAPVLADVSTVKRFSQDGCARLAVRLSQASVPTSDGKETSFAIRYEMNLCRDGTPPAEGMDLSVVSRTLAPVSPALPNESRDFRARKSSGSNE